MKKVLLILSLLIAAPVMASEELYQALDVEERPLPASRQVLAYVKEVGGISCTKKTYINLNTSFSCEADLQSMNAQEIYEALAVDAENLLEITTRVKFQKEVGSLSCTVSRPAFEMRDPALYNCKIKL